MLDFAERISGKGIQIHRCLQCGKCTAGCPVAFAMDYAPRQVIRFVQQGQVDTLLVSRCFWLCTGCSTCSTRCPQQVGPMELMGELRLLAGQQGRVAEPEVHRFNKIFMDLVQKYGRMHEASLVLRYNFQSGRIFKDANLGPGLLFRGKLPLRPVKIKGIGVLRRTFSRQFEKTSPLSKAQHPQSTQPQQPVQFQPQPGKFRQPDQPMASGPSARSFALFPGCSWESTGREYRMSTQAVAQALDLEFREIPDWNCCGASSAASVQEVLALALPARNLAQAEAQGLNVVAPCAGCYSRLRSAEFALRNADSQRRLAEILEQPMTGQVQVYSLLEILGEKSRIQEIKARQQQSLAGLKLVSYYGCLLVRPPETTGFADPENPQVLEQLVGGIGAEALDWPGKTECCGGNLISTHPNLALQLVDKLLHWAQEAGAEALVCACPLCVLNLDARQKSLAKKFGRSFHLPIFYFSQLIGLALGIDPKELGLNRHFVDPWELLQQRKLV